MPIVPNTGLSHISSHGALATLFQSRARTISQGTPSSPNSYEAQAPCRVNTASPAVTHTTITRKTKHTESKTCLQISKAVDTTDPKVHWRQCTKYRQVYEYEYMHTRKVAREPLLYCGCVPLTLTQSQWKLFRHSSRSRYRLEPTCITLYYHSNEYISIFIVIIIFIVVIIVTNANDQAWRHSNTMLFIFA